jgi:murein DD-endopeptidase MepM/ murein hydrolase activator NlpD
MPEPSPNLACEPERDCLGAQVAKTLPDSELKNTLVLRRNIRIRVLDCRSGKPLVGEPVREVRLNGDPLAKFLAFDYFWDISKHFPISGTGAKRYFGLKSVTLVKASQIALNALGYDCGTPGNSYRPQGKTAFLKFRFVAHAVVLPDVPDPLPEDKNERKKFEALRQFKLKLFDQDKPVLPKEFQPAAGKKTLQQVKDASGNEIEFRGPTDAEADELVKIYNTKCYRAAQFHLASLGFYPKDDAQLKDGVLDAPDCGEWPEQNVGWQKAFKDWQKVTFNRSDAQCFPFIKREQEGKALMEQKRGFVSDDRGDIHIPIPVARLQEKKDIQVEVAFKNFAVVAEATLEQFRGTGEKLHRAAVVEPHRPIRIQSEGGPTGFSVEWVTPGGGQKNEWDKPWGWRCGRGRSTSAGQRSAFKEFRTSWKFTIPAFTQAELDDPKKGPSWSVLHNRTANGGVFSIFYESEQTTPEFVLFALVWCQPVWDDFDDPPPRGNNPAVHTNSYIWGGTPPEFTGLHMHVVTQFYDLAGKDAYGGMGYGLSEFQNLPGNKTRWRGGHGHPGGIDLHNPVGAECFAVHAGKLSYQPNSNGFGHLAYVVWDGAPGAQNSVYYGHVHDKVGAAGRWVWAGEIIATGGRQGWLFPGSDQAGHVHLLVNGIAQSENAPNLFDAPDPANQVCIPFNNLDADHWVTAGTPLLLPCKCQVEYAAAELSGCEFGDVAVKYKHTTGAASPTSYSISQSCWAVGCLACPHMPRPQASDLAKLAEAPANKVKRRVQAQLRYLMNRGKLEPNQEDADALPLSGDLGAYDSKVKCIAPKEDNIRDQPGAAGQVIGTAKPGEQYTWLEVNDDGTWIKIEIPPANRKAGSEAPTGWTHKTVVQKPQVSKTREAIFAFKRNNKDDKGNPLLPGNATPDQKFKMDQPALDALNKLAPIIPLP